jgi:hypothetical protein
MKLFFNCFFAAEQADPQAVLTDALAEGRRSGEEQGWISSEEVRKHFKDRAAEA